MYFKIILKFL